MSQKPAVKALNKPFFPAQKWRHTARRILKMGSLSLFLLYGCGDESNDDARSCLPDSFSNSINLNDSDELVQASSSPASALEGSYIVNFRVPSSERGGPQAWGASFLTESLSHDRFLRPLHQSDYGIRRFHHITSVPMSPKFIQRLPTDAGFSGFIDRGSDRSFLQGSTPLESEGTQEGSLARVDFRDEQTAQETLNRWKDEGRIWYAEPNYVSQPRVVQDNLFQSYADTYRDLNYWWLSTIKLVEAFESIATRDLASSPSDDNILSRRPIIAVIDSGVDSSHPALENQMWVNSDPGAARCGDDRFGCNTTTANKETLGDGDSFPFGAPGPGQACLGDDPNCSHGTHVAGIIAGDPNWDSNDGSRAPGVCPICRIMSIRVVGKVGNKSGVLDSSILAAFKYLALFKHQGESAVRIINASFGKFNRSRSVGLLVRLLKEKSNTLVIGAAGNEDTLTMEYPAAFSDAIAVTAVDESLAKANFSNFGRWVDVAAPGDKILSTIPGGGLAQKSGTSMAAPMVSGVAGLMLARFPNINFDTMRFWLLNSSDPTFYKESHGGGYNYHCYYPKITGEDVRQPLLGSGVLQANQAIRQVATDGLPLFTDLDRVERGCATIARNSLGESEPPLGLLFFLILLLPLGFAVFIPNAES